MIQTVPATNGHNPEPQSWQDAFTEDEQTVIANCRTQIMQKYGGHMVAIIAKLADQLDRMEERVYLPY